VSRFSPAKVYSILACVGVALSAATVWLALHWWPAWIPLALLAAFTAGAAWVALRPSIEVNESHLVVGTRTIAWDRVRRVDQTNWLTPMVVYLTTAEGPRLKLIYPGVRTRCDLLLRLIQQRSTQALINGVPHRRIFGEPAPVQPERTATVRPRFLSDQDEADVERMLQILKSVGRLDGNED
jgi:hypothetical protein